MHCLTNHTRFIARKHLKRSSSAPLIARYILRFGQALQKQQCPRCSTVIARCIVSCDKKSRRRGLQANHSKHLAILTKADRANDEGGSGGDGSCIKPPLDEAPASRPVEAINLAELAAVVVPPEAVTAMPCLDLRMTAETAGLWLGFWPKFLGKVAAAKGILRLGGGGGWGSMSMWAPAIWPGRPRESRGWWLITSLRWANLEAVARLLRDELLPPWKNRRKLNHWR